MLMTVKVVMRRKVIRLTTEKERIQLIRSRIVVWGIDMTNESYCDPAQKPLFQTWEQAAALKVQPWCHPWHWEDNVGGDGKAC